MNLIIISCRKTSLIMRLKLSQTNLLGFVPFLVLRYPTHSSSGFWGWTTMLVQQDLLLGNPFWLFLWLALSCAQKCVPRGFIALFSQIWCLYFTISLFSVSWTLFQGCDSQCSNWLFHAHLVLSVLVNCRSSCASHLVGSSYSNVNKLSLHPPKASLNCLCPAMLPLLKMSGQW